ncbi:MAG: DNA topoisomerase VI [Planctomycetota bacterium]
MGKELNDPRKRILECAREVRRNIDAGSTPQLRLPKRSLSNVTYTPQEESGEDQQTGYLKLADGEITRTLSYNTVKSFAQTLRMMALAKDTVEGGEEVSKREAYYISKNWEDARFDKQPESDTVMEDIEAMFRLNREQLGFVPEEKGGEVAGPLRVLDRDPKSGQQIKIDCERFGRGAYSVPISVEDLEFDTEAEFILVVETAGMFQRLNNHAFWRKANCILVSMGGVPTRACRRFVRRLSEDEDLPVYAFVDGDPYGYANIYRTLKVGSGNSAHINEYFCVPGAKLLGVTPEDIKKYELPTHPLTDTDIKRAKDTLKNDPFFQHHGRWRKAIKAMLKMGERAEQQAFAKHSLNFVLETYLPEKLEERDTFLP